MKSLPVPKVRSAADFFRDASPSGGNVIGCVNWPEYPYRPGVSFAIAHTGRSVCLKYFVDEKYTRGVVTDDNGRVCNDSCVEFFVAFNDKGYYNLEFNCIGTAMVKYRTDPQNVELADAGILRSIVRVPSLGREPLAELTDGQRWSLELEIPAAVFFRDAIDDFSGMKARANFYKCGDELTEVHYLSWNPISNDKPNFHLPEYFGELIFER